MSPAGSLGHRAGACSAQQHTRGSDGTPVSASQALSLLQKTPSLRQEGAGLMNKRPGGRGWRQSSPTATAWQRRGSECFVPSLEMVPSLLQVCTLWMVGFGELCSSPTEQHWEVLGWLRASVSPPQEWQGVMLASPTPSEIKVHLLFQPFVDTSTQEKVVWASSELGNKEQILPRGSRGAGPCLSTLPTLHHLPQSARRLGALRDARESCG